MLRKTVTAAHGNVGTEEALAAAKNDTGALAAKTEAALSAADKAAEEQAVRDAEARAKALARSKSGIKSFGGCVC